MQIAAMSATGIAAAAALVYAAWCGVAWAVQDRLVFPRVQLSGGNPPFGVESLWLEIERGGRVEAWFARGRGATVQTPGPAVIFAHGNGEVIDDDFSWLAPYLELGVSVFLPEYRGYGRSDGRPSQAAIGRDMVRFHDLLAARPEVDPGRIVFHGRSLGGGVVAALAAERRPAALILESTFTSIVAIWKRAALPAFLCRNPFRSDQALHAYDGPVLIFHGSRDEVIPVGHGRRLHKLLPGSRYVEMDAGHNDFPPDPVRYWETIRGFLTRNGILRPPLQP